MIQTSIISLIYFLLAFLLAGAAIVLILQNNSVDEQPSDRIDDFGAKYSPTLFSKPINDSLLYLKTPVI